MENTTSFRKPITIQDVADMVERVDSRLLESCRYEEFEPGEGIYRIGDYGYVTVDEWAQAFKGEPAWAEPIYMLDANQCDRQDEWTLIYDACGIDGLSRRLDEQFEHDQADVCFYTEADDEGHA